MDMNNDDDARSSAASAFASRSRRPSTSDRSAAVDGCLKRRFLTKAIAGDSADVASLDSAAARFSRRDWMRATAWNSASESISLYEKGRCISRDFGSCFLPGPRVLYPGLWTASWTRTASTPTIKQRMKAAVLMKRGASRQRGMADQRRVPAMARKKVKLSAAAKRLEKIESTDRVDVGVTSDSDRGLQRRARDEVLERHHEPVTTKSRAHQGAP